MEGCVQLLRLHFFSASSFFGKPSPELYFRIIRYLLQRMLQLNVLVVLIERNDIVDVTVLYYKLFTYCVTLL